MGRDSLSGVSIDAWGEKAEKFVCLRGASPFETFTEYFN